LPTSTVQAPQSPSATFLVPRSVGEPKPVEQGFGRDRGQGNILAVEDEAYFVAILTLAILNSPGRIAVARRAAAW
jgi:hypothetical protein